MGSTDPQTLVECIVEFSDKAVAFEFFKELRGPNGPACPDCGCSDDSSLSTRLRFKCKACKRQYSVN